VRTPITAALLREPGQPLELAEVLLDAPAAHEAVVRTERVGLCHSDLHYLNGALSIATPAILGHEVAGVVQTVGAAVTNVAPGDRVVATITPSCGLCPACLRGRPTQCARVEQTRRRERPKLLTSQGDEITVLGDLGGFAEAFLASERSLAKLPPGLDPAVACLLGCCVSTGVGAALHGAKITAEDTVAVIGCGGVGDRRDPGRPARGCPQGRRHRRGRGQAPDRPQIRRFRRRAGWPRPGDDAGQAA